MIEWHHIFGMALTDLFTDSKYRVEVEKELKMNQFLDILVVEEQTGNAISELPDGFEDLSKYNLITYKSLRQPLDSWSLDELICYYVLYRKLVSPSLDNLMPTDQFRLFGISTRYPQNLSQIEHLEYVKNGIYRLIRGEFEISILVLSRMPLNQRDAIWNMFATKQKQIQFGLENSRWKSNDFKQSVINILFQKYQSENIILCHTLKRILSEIQY